MGCYILLINKYFCNYLTATCMWEKERVGKGICRETEVACMLSFNVRLLPQVNTSFSRHPPIIPTGVVSFAKHILPVLFLPSSADNFTAFISLILFPSVFKAGNSRLLQYTNTVHTHWKCIDCAHKHKTMCHLHCLFQPIPIPAVLSALCAPKPA